MDFNRLVLKGFETIIHKNNLHVIEQFINYLKFESDQIEIILSHDERENSNSFYIGLKDDFLYPIDENVLKGVFNFALKINNVTPEVFVNNLVVFIENVGKPLIEGNKASFQAVVKFIYEKSHDYTAELLHQQSIVAANKAWEEGNYKDFIMHMDKIDRRILPLQYVLKYKMAYLKLKNKTL